MSGTHVKGVVRIALDDTDHVDHACTTEHFQRLLSMLEVGIDNFSVLERRLVDSGLSHRRGHGVMLHCLQSVNWVRVLWPM